MTSPLVVFGGTFDPPHRRHITLAEEAMQALGAGEVLLVPARVNPQRVEHPPAPATERLEMVRLATIGHPGLSVSDIEILREGPSYTVDTLRELRRRGERRPLRLLIGSDQALNFHTWREADAILELATPAVVLRPPHTRESFARALTGRERGCARRAARANRWLEWLLPIESIDCSSTEARRRLVAGEAVGDLLDPRVESYIRAHGLYGAAPA